MFECQIVEAKCFLLANGLKYIHRNVYSKVKKRTLLLNAIQSYENDFVHISPTDSI
jgi:hypothetical protein